MGGRVINVSISVTLVGVGESPVFVSYAMVAIHSVIIIEIEGDQLQFKRHSKKASLLKRSE